MVQSLFDKIRVFTLGNLHQLLDAVIDTNSLPVVKQYARDLERAIDQLKEAVIVADGSLRTARRDQRTAADFMAELNGDIDTLLGDSDPSNDNSALSLQVRYDATAKRMAGLDQMVTDKTAALTRLTEAINRVEAKHAEMIANIERLEGLEEGRKGMDAASAAVKKAQVSAVDAPSIDSVARRIQARYDQSTARFDRAMSAVEGATGQSEAVASAEAALARRKAALANKS